jgi:chemotaxis protein MotB
MARKFKKVEGGHGHHGGAWKVAYADFVTAMMALFMVMWLLASTDQQTRQEISNYFRTGVLPDGDLSMNRAAQITPSVIQTSPSPAPPGQEALDEKSAAATELVSRLDRLAANDPTLADVMRNVHIAVNQDGILIEAVDEARGLLFDLASARLNEPLERFLHALGPALAAINRPIEINGHTDARPFVQGARVSNWDLSYQRADAAREILEASGVAPRQITGVFARGASQLYIPADPLAPQNRRLSILVKIGKPADTKLAKTERIAPN